MEFIYSFLENIAGYLGAFLCFSLVLFVTCFLVYLSFLCLKGAVKIGNFLIVSFRQDNKGDN